MSLMTINIPDSVSGFIRKVAESLISGEAELSGLIDLSIPDRIEISCERNDGSFLIEWSPPVEADLPGPVNPDIARVRVFDDHAIIDLAVSNIRVDYGSKDGDSS